MDPRKTLTAETSNLLVQLKPNSDYELISALLTLLHGKTPHPSVEDITGVSIPVMEKNARFDEKLQLWDYLGKGWTIFFNREAQEH